MPDGIVVVKYFIQKLKEKCFLKGTASYVTALSRKKLYKSMYDCEWEIWYSDTDSFITSKKLPTSNELGDIKLEYTLKDCLFVSPKVYWLETEEGDQVAHMKGVNRKVFLDENTGKVRGDCK